MNVKEEKFEGQLSMELTNMILTPNQLVGLDEMDIKQVVNRRKGKAFIFKQEEGDGPTFMKNSFKVLKEKEEVKGSKYILISIQTTGSTLNMEDMNHINDFMDSLEDDFELKWGIAQLEEKAKMCIILLASK